MHVACKCISVFFVLDLVVCVFFVYLLLREPTV